MTRFSYENLMIDPPWPQQKGGKRQARPNQGRNLAYKTLTLPNLWELLDQEILCKGADTHNVWLWAIDKFLPDAETFMRERGYRLHARLIWDKGNGIAPAFTIRYCHEYLLWWYKPRLLSVCPEQRGKFLTVLREPARQHSRKPEIAYQLVESLYPHQKRLSVFSRDSRPFWDHWGDEIGLFNNE